MGAESTGVVERLRQPEYTGANRCTPCTIVNVVIAAAGSVAASVLGTPAVGVATFALCLAAIYLRGYLVPGTPTLTRRYFPEWLLAKFDKRDSEAAAVGDGGDDRRDRDPEDVLAAADAVEPCEGVDDLCLVDSFRAEWNEKMEAIEAAGTEKSDLRAVLGVDEGELSFTEHDEAIVARLDGRRLGQWESRAALIADLAAAKVLEDRYDDWSGLTVANQSRVLSGLRIFLQTCPDCGGDVSMDEETVESCCRTTNVVAVSCTACDARLLEVERD